jgi:hypothetical protein
VNKILLTITLLSFASIQSFGQGCSDAGFCTMGAMKPDQSYSRKINFKLRSVEFNYYRGKTTLTPIVHVYTADIAIGINDKNSFQIKLPYQTVTGNLGDTKGLGDISFSASHIFPKFKKFNIGVTIGGKIPSGHSDKEATSNKFAVAGKPAGDLPMYYQVSLGTYDFVAGASIINEKWLFATGIQIPIIDQNNNDFRWRKWDPAPGGYVDHYNLANNLKRGTDVMLRAERNFRFLNYNFSIGALPIYRITKDEVFDFKNNKNVKLDGTTGLALSILSSAGYHFNVNHSLKLIYGYKLTDRKVNPDGLTRDNVISVSYVYRF